MTAYSALTEQRRLGHQHRHISPRFRNGKVEFDPVPPDPDPCDGLRAFRGIIIGAVLGTLLWAAIGWLAGKAL